MAVLAVNVFVMLGCLLYVNSYFYSLDVSSSTVWVLLVVLAVYAGSLRHNLYMIRNTVIPLFYNYDNYYLN